MKTKEEKTAYIASIIKENPGISANEIQRRIKGTPYATRKTILLDIISGLRGKWSHKYIKKSNIKKGKNKKYQMFMWGDYENEDTKEIRKNIKGISNAYSELKYDLMLEECIFYALGQLGGSNWHLIKIKTIKYIQWHRK